MDERLQDRIDEYILGRMSDEERKTFEEEMAKDSSLQEQYNYTKMVKEAVCEHAELKERMYYFDRLIEKERQEEQRKVYSTMPAEHAVNYCAMPRREVVTTKPRRRILLWVTGIAAIVIVGLFVVSSLFQQESLTETSNMAVNESLPEDTSKMIKESVSGIGGYEEIEELMVNRDYDQALAKIEEEEMVIVKLNSSSSNPSFKSSKKETYEDVTHKTMSSEHDVQLRKDTLKWLKINALIGLGRTEEALPLLDQLRKGNGEYKAKAEQLYNKVKGL